MTRQGPRYHQHTPAWNKNMVKRVLENAKYTGAEGCPLLVSDEDFATARCQRSSRNTYAPLSAEIRPILVKMVCAQCGGKLARGARSHGRVHWRCQEPDCGQSVSISDEALAEMVDRRFRTRLEQGPVDAGILSALLTAAVRAVWMVPDKAMALELVSGTIITEKKEVQCA